MAYLIPKFQARVALRREKTKQNFASIVAIAAGFILLIKSVHTGWNKGVEITARTDHLLRIYFFQIVIGKWRRSAAYDVLPETGWEHPRSPQAICHPQ